MENRTNKFKNFIELLKVALKLLFKSSKIHLFFMIVLSIVSGIPALVNITIWKKILDEIVISLNGELHLKQIVLLFALHFIFISLSILLQKITNYIRDIYTVIVDRYISEEIIESISKFTLELIEDAENQNDIEKVNTQSASRIMNILETLITILRNMTTFLGTFTILLRYNPLIIIIIGISIIPTLTINRKSMDKLYEVYETRYEKMRLSSSLKKMIALYENFKEFKVYSGFDFIRRKNNDIYSDLISQDRKIKKSLTIQSTLGDILGLIITYSFKIMIVIEGIKKRLTIGSIAMYIESADYLQNSFINIFASILRLYENCLYLNGYQRIIEKANMIIANQKENLITEFSIDSIEFKDVSYKYKTGTAFALKNISLKLKRGEIYTIVGFNGSGKTTLIKLIAGLYEPTLGEIYINGINIKNYDMDVYHSKISVSFQEFVKLPMTIRDNICISDIKNIDNIEAVVKASEFGLADSFIKSLPKQYEEKVSIGWADSKELSTGQWQRLNISRCYFKNDADVFLLDEPTSTLDLKTEYAIYNNIKKYKSKNINIIITHRFVNIRNMDLIIVLENGSIAEIGNHHELYKKNSVYTELYDIHSKLT